MEDYLKSNYRRNSKLYVTTKKEELTLRNVWFVRRPDSSDHCPTAGSCKSILAQKCWRTRRKWLASWTVRKPFCDEAFLWSRSKSVAVTTVRNCNTTLNYFETEVSLFICLSNREGRLHRLLSERPFCFGAGRCSWILYRRNLGEEKLVKFFCT